MLDILAWFHLLGKSLLEKSLGLCESLWIPQDNLSQLERMM